MQTAVRSIRRIVVRRLAPPLRRLADAVCLGYDGGGIGDHLMLSTLAHEYKRRGQGRVFVISDFPDLFHRNPDIDGVTVPGTRMAWLYTKLADNRVLRPHYLINCKPDDTRDPPPDPVLAYLCRVVGMTGRVDLRPYVTLSEAERAWGIPYRGGVAIQSTGMSARYPTPNKEWFPDRFAEVAAHLIREHPIVQIGNPADPPVPHTHDLRGKTTLRQLAAVLANCRMFVGLEGMPMHVARTVECPSVIVYGGRLRPDEIGYICNENLYRATPCSPCWRHWRCEYDRVCLSSIGTRDVIEAAERMLARPRDGLAVETYEIR
jgi:hypothetical protein